MSKSNYLENELLKYVFQNITPGFNADGTYYFTLHSGDPGEAGTQATNEIVYTGWARVAIVRSNAQWSVVLDTATNINTITCPLCTGGTDTATHGSIGRAASGAGEILYKGALASSLIINNNQIPTIPPGDASFTEA